MYAQECFSIVVPLISIYIIPKKAAVKYSLFMDCISLKKSIVLSIPDKLINSSNGTIMLSSSKAHMYTFMFNNCPGKLDLQTLIYTADNDFRCC